VYKILCIGPQWRGSNAGGFFKALSRLGHIVSIVDEFYHVPLRGKSLLTKIISSFSRNLYIKEFNKEILKVNSIFQPDIMIVYKGAFVYPQTLLKIKPEIKLLVNFFPDVSIHTHGDLLQKTLPIYDYIFTTKTFGVSDLKSLLNIQSAYFIPHGFDPDIHRNLDISNIRNNPYLSDVSFIGTWSPKKENYISSIIRKLPYINLKIFGSQWYKARGLVKSRWVGYEVLGDAYALAINSSKINLGLLSEKVRGASSGDKITSRTFHIPASAGFMIHERTEEIANYFIEDIEIVCFDNPDELISKIQYYIDNESERDKIRMAGYKRAVKNYSLEKRAFELMKIIENKLN
jgi:glycosyltransferase involved in cell wall biosynthesis